MPGSSSQLPSRSMEDKCTTLRNLRPDVQNWFVKVVIAEKTPICLMKWGTTQQKLVFVDKENERMQCIIYQPDVDQLDKILQLYKSYYIGNGRIKEMTPSTPILASSRYQMVLNRSNYIKQVSQQDELHVEHIYQLTPFTQCPEFADIKDRQINLLCGVIHVFPPRVIQKTGRNLQDFVIVNEECRPMILTLWEEFLQNEAPYLTENVHEMPVILGMRLSMNTFHGLSIGTLPNSTILFHPPIAQTEHLKSWLKANKEYLDTVVSQELYAKEKQIIHEPLHSQVRKISQILSFPQTVKSYWIKAKLKITKSKQCLYFLACPNCSKSCGAAFGYEFTCLYCNNDFPNPKAMLRFEVELFDGTGSLNAFLEQKEAETLIGMSGQEIIEAELQGKSLNCDDIDKKFKDLELFFHIRTSRNEYRGKILSWNTIIACLPTSELSLASQSSAEKASSSGMRKKLIADVPMLETQESSSSGKRSLDSTGASIQSELKHAKPD